MEHIDKDNRLNDQIRTGLGLLPVICIGSQKRLNKRKGENALYTALASQGLVRANISLFAGFGTLARYKKKCLSL